VPVPRVSTLRHEQLGGAEQQDHQAAGQRQHLADPAHSRPVCTETEKSIDFGTMP
jgi:hypothetical protein